MQDWKMREKNCVWNTVHCLFLLSPAAFLCILRCTAGATGSRLPNMPLWRLCDGTHTSLMCESDETHTTGWGQVAHGLRTVIGCCKDGRQRRWRWTDRSRDLSNEQTQQERCRWVEISPKAPKICVVNVTYSCTSMKITNKFVGINTPRMCPQLHFVSDGAYRHFCLGRSKNLNTMYIYKSVRKPGFVYEWSLVKGKMFQWRSALQAPPTTAAGRTLVCVSSRPKEQ